MFNGNKLVFHIRGDFFSRSYNPVTFNRNTYITASATAGNFRECIDFLVGFTLENIRIYIHFSEELRNKSVFLLEKSGEQMHRFNNLIGLHNRCTLGFSYSVH